MRRQLLIFGGVGLLLTWPALGFPFYGDDLHLIRVFSRDELLLAWQRNWDLDGYESIGYRPLTLMFNSARALLFGESTAAHRLFLIALFAGYLAMIGEIGRRLLLSTAATTTAGVMILCAKYNSYHVLWIADGVHLAQGLLFTFAALAALRFVDSNATRWLGVSTAWFVVSVLIREDSLAVAPVLIGLSAYCSWRGQRLPAQQLRLTGYAAGLLVIAVAVFGARQLALSGHASPPWTAPKYLAAHAVEIVTLAGWQPSILAVAFVGIFVLLVAATWQWRSEGAKTAWLLLALAGLSSSAGIVESRVNLLLFPITFYCLFAGHVLTAYASGQTRFSGVWGRAIAIVVAIVCIVVPARESRRQQLNLAPGSTDHLAFNCDIARGGEWFAVTSPVRRESALQELRRLGIDLQACETLIGGNGAVLANTALPAGVFRPPLRFLSR